MKFSEKYELLESVTKGQVRTFLAREVSSRTRVVVHIFDCPGNHSGQMAGQWVLQAFRNLAPSPLGQVLEVGSYEDSSYAYIVTKMPDAAALQAWVRAYRMHCASTEDLSREPKPKGSDITTVSLDVNDIREVLAEAAPETKPAPDAAPAPREFTKAFWDLAGKPAEQSDSAKSAGTPADSFVAPTSMAGSSSGEETRLRANAVAVAKAEIEGEPSQVAPPSVWRVRPEQFAALEQVSHSDMEARIAAQLRPILPAQYQQMAEQDLRKAVRYGIHRAASHYIAGDIDVARYVGLMFAFGPDFDRDAQLPWASDILNDPNVADASLKMARLWEAGEKALAMTRARRASGE